MPGLLNFLQDPRTAAAAGLLTPTRNRRTGPALLQGLGAAQQQTQGNQQQLLFQQEQERLVAEQERQKQLQAGRAGVSGIDQAAIIERIQSGDLQGAQALISAANAFKEQSPAAVVNVGGEKPLGSSAANWTNAAGKNPPATYGVTRAVTEGYKPRTTEQLKSIQAGKAATPVISDIVSFGFGTEGEKSLFPPKSKGTSDRLIGAGMDYIKGITKSDERISLYNDSKRAFRAGIARLLGHTGVLTKKDVGDATALIPVPGLTTESQAKRQFQQMSDLLMGLGVSRSDLEELGMPEWAFGDSGSEGLSPEDEALLRQYE